ncbi:MAG: response regulator [Planktothrix sp.]
MVEKAIICVDDEGFILESILEQLKRKFGNEYIYEGAESAPEALDIIEDLQQQAIEVLIIVSDWLMPEMRGDEFLIEVHRRFPKIIKVMLTGQADEEAIKRAEKHANLYRCIYKPWTEEELAQTIASALG